MTRPRIAIVGAGPSGCYSAQALIKEFPDADICVFDALPVPFGLIRHGVAADHQGTKAVDKQFARLFEKSGVRFFGGIIIGLDIDLATLRDAFDAVVLAHGLHGDVALDIPGAELDGVIGAGRITRLLNGHALEARPAPELGTAVAVVGMGNVAIDLVRLLAKSGQDFMDSDIDDDVHAQLTAGLRTIHVVGRSRPNDAKFDVSMLRELLDLELIEHVVHGIDDDPQADPRSSILSQLHRSPRSASARLRIEWWFGSIPTEVYGDDRVSGLRIARPGSGQDVTLSVDSVITAIGFTAEPHQRLSTVGPEAAECGRIAPGLYVAGWARRGPRGTIPTHRADARQLASLIAGDLRGPFTRAGTAGLDDDLSGSVSYEGWLRVDSHETSTAAAGRVRRKVTDIDQLHAIAGSHRWQSNHPSDLGHETA